MSIIFLYEFITRLSVHAKYHLFLNCLPLRVHIISSANFILCANLILLRTLFIVRGKAKLRIFSTKHCKPPTNHRVIELFYHGLFDVKDLYYFTVKLFYVTGLYILP